MIDELNDKRSFSANRFINRIDMTTINYNTDIHGPETSTTSFKESFEHATDAQKLERQLHDRLDTLITKKANEKMIIKAMVMTMREHDQVSLDLADLISLSYFNTRPHDLNMSSLRKNLHIAILKELNANRVSALMYAAQSGDRGSYRHVLQQLNQILCDFFKKHYPNSFDHDTMCDQVLRRVHDVRHTYHKNQDFLDWFFAITRQTLKKVAKQQREGFDLSATETYKLSTAQLSQLAITRAKKEST